MKYVLDFMYHGEVNVAQEELDKFLEVAETLKKSPDAVYRWGPVPLPRFPLLTRHADP